MFASRYTTLLCSALLLILPSILAQSCDDTDHCTAWYACLCPQCADYLQCAVCGYQGSAPIYCVAYNSVIIARFPTAFLPPTNSHQTFDDLTKGSSIVNYQSAMTLTNFTVAYPGAGNPIKPASQHYARSPSGTGTISFTSGLDVGDLHSFAYACTDPKSNRPVPCNITVTAGCLATDAGNQYAWYYDHEFEYTPVKVNNKTNVAAMESGTWENGGADYNYDPFLQYNAVFCYNFTWKAVMASGKPAVLFLDDVVYNGWVYTGI